MKDEGQEEFGGTVERSAEVFAGNSQGWAAGAGLLPSTASSFLFLFLGILY